MKTRKKNIPAITITAMIGIALIVILASMVASGPVKEADVATETAVFVQQAATQDTAKTSQAEQTLAAEMEMNKTATASAESTAIAQQTLDAQMASEQAIQQATQQAAPMYAVVQRLVDDGVLNSLDGNYYLLPDLRDSWAQTNFYQWTQTGYAPKNFAVRANVSWESASDIANWFSSGCGFVFREVDKDNHYMVFLGLDGLGHMMRTVKGVQVDLGSDSHVQLDVPNGQASIMLTVENDWISLFVNDQRVLHRQDKTLSEGKLSFTIVSGTNAGFGTRCDFKNVELWEVK
jgi:hypothetical protein